MMSLNLQSGSWIHPPNSFEIQEDSLLIQSDPGTDFWQRSYYGFRNNNAPALLFQRSDNFSLTATVSFRYHTRFDQCGLILFQDQDTWFKASIEYEHADLGRLGSVVTNNGYSDWATCDIPLPESISYRLHRRGPDFMIESSVAGQAFQQMRIFHLHALGDTSLEMGQADPPLPAAVPVRVGFYACSPMESSFQARFHGIRLENCLWKAHSQD